MLDELKKLDAGYEWTVDEGMTFPYRGQGIVVPTLEELFTAFPDMRMNIEIKEIEPSLFCRDSLGANHSGLLYSLNCCLKANLLFIAHRDRRLRSPFNLNTFNYGRITISTA